MEVSKQFIKRLKDAEKSAYKELFDNYAGIIKSIAYRYLGSWDSAEDILQETFLIIFQKIHQYSGKGAFEGWIKRIVANNCLKQLKIEKKVLFNDINDDLFREDSAIEYVNEKDVESLIKSCDFSRDEILEVVTNLPRGFRLVFSMYVLENYKHKEIAKKLKISESTSKTQLMRARKLLQKNLYIKAKQKHSVRENVLLNKLMENKK